MSDSMNLKIFLDADPDKKNDTNKVTGEKIIDVMVNAPHYLTHDIFFQADLVVYTNPADKTGSTLSLLVDYNVSFQDTIATEQAARPCYRQLVFYKAYPIVYVDYHVYGDIITADIVNDVRFIASNALETAEQTAQDFSRHTDETDAHGAVSELAPKRLALRNSRGTFSISAPELEDEPARKKELDTEAASREKADTDHKNAVTLDHPDASVTDAKIGSRTAIDTTTHASLTGTVTQLFSLLAKLIKGITGKSSALTAPAITLEAANTHVNTTNEPHGATSAATAGRIIQRDANGRAQVASPSAADDIARKAETDAVQVNLNTHKTAIILDHPDASVTDAKIGSRTATDTTTHASLTGTVTQLFSLLAKLIKGITGKSSALTAPAITLEAANTHVNTTNEPHGATSAATAGRIIQRDANGRVQVANPLADADIANKGYVTGLMAGLSLQDVYSLSEVKTINVWADGKAIYRKGLLISSLPKAASASISFALTGVTGITNVLGIARNKTTGRVLTLPHPLINIKAALSSGNITGQIVTGADRTGWEAYVFVEYTK